MGKSAQQSVYLKLVLDERENLNSQIGDDKEVLKMCSVKDPGCKYEQISAYGGSVDLRLNDLKFFLQLILFL